MKMSRWMAVLVWAMCICLFTACAVSVQSAVIYVSQSGNDTNSGSDWSHAKKTVGAALATALPLRSGVTSDAPMQSGDDIWVAAGTYTECITLKPGVGLYGGFSGTETSFDQRSWLTNVTILDGGQAGSVITVPDAADKDTIINGFTIRNGSASSGGGIHCGAGSPLIVNNRITGNTATSGGGISSGGGSPTIAGNIITLNTAANGAGVYSTNSKAHISNNTICKNTSSVHGGAIGGSNSSIVVANNIVASNSSGLCFAGGQPALKANCVHTNGDCDYYGVSAGATDISGDPLLVNLSTNDYHLTSNSPCVDAGANDLVESAALDMDMRVRLSGDHVDIGAYEYEAESTSGVSNASTGGVGLSSIGGRRQSKGVSAGSLLGNGVSGSSLLKKDANSVRLMDTGGGGSDPDVIYVKYDAPGSTHDGSSWDNAYLTVQDGINAAVSGKKVWVARGTYHQLITTKSGVALYGGFAGTETALADRPAFPRTAPDSNAAILDGQDTNGTFLGNSVVNIAGTSGTLIHDITVDGFTIQHGQGYHSGSNWNGGGIRCTYTNGTVTISNNQIVNNGMPDPTGTNNYAGGIYCSYSPALITKNRIDGNTAVQAGGIYIGTGSPVITYNSISGNTATSYGGAIYAYGDASTIAGNVIGHNTAHWGGGIYGTSSTGIAIKDNSIVHNTSTSSIDGIMCSGTVGSIANNTIADNNSRGIYIKANSTVAITNNIVSYHVYGFYCENSTVTLTKNCFYGNTTYNYCAASPTHDSDINVDPLFVDRTNEDYHIAITSPCINAGDDTAVASGDLDVDTQTRINGAHVDIGSDEMYQVSTPTYSPGPDTYTSAQTVTISTATTGASIYYTTDGTTPTRNSLLYTAPILVNQSQALNAIAIETNWADSAPTVSSVYNITGMVSAPTFSPTAGTFTTPQTVAISSATSGASIHYTIDGTAATKNSTLYTSPISVDHELTLNAIAVKTGWADDSAVTASAHYNITGKVAKPTFNPVSGTYPTAQTVTISCTTPGASIRYTTDGTNPTSSSTLYSTPISVTTNTTLKAKAFHVDWDDSDIASASYAIVKATYVNGNLPASGTHNGTSWSTAFRTVQEGIDAAASGEQVWVAAATYYTVITAKSGVALYGGFAGNETSVSQRDWAANVTILDGENKQHVTDSFRDSVVFVPTGATISTIIDGFTIKRGLGTGNGVVKGGGIRVVSASATITHNVICLNNKCAYGNGICVTSGSPIIKDNVFYGNDYGSLTTGTNVIYVDGGTPIIDNNTIIHNSGVIGIALFNCNNAVVTNNILCWNDTGITTSGCTGTTISYNCDYGNTISDNIAGNNGNIGVDPGLVNSSTSPYDCHLISSSPCMNAGNNNAASSSDRDVFGQMRIIDSTVDIGACERPLASVATLTFYPSGGTYSDTQNVTITCSQAGVTIRYTTDGTAPTSSSAVYSNPISVDRNMTIRAMASMLGYTDSGISSADYVIQPLPPVISLASGTYEWKRNITLTCASSGVSYFYTIDDTTPTTSSTPSSGTVVLDKSMKLTVISARTGCTSSTPTSATYTVTVPAPTFSPAAGSYSSPHLVKITDSALPAAIYYTTDGSTPTTSSLRYTRPLPVNVSMILRAIAQITGCTSTEASAAYTITGHGATLTFTPDGGIFTTPQNVAIDCDQSNTSIYYTTDGSDPSTDSAVYTGPIPISESSVLRAIVYSSGTLAGKEKSANYFMDVYSSDIIRVSPDGSDFYQGDSWSLPMKTITAALSHAPYGSEIWVKAGTYNERIALVDGVGLYGGFVGNETMRSQRPAFPRAQGDTNQTIIDAQALGSVVNCGEEVDAGCVLDGFTITGGSGTLINGSTYGGGIFLVDASPTLMNNTIQVNSASVGAGIYCSQSAPMIWNNVITGNTATGRAGGVYCESSSPSIVGCMITSNTGTTAAGLDCFNGSTPNIINDTFVSNAAGSGNAAIMIEDWNPTIANTIVAFNGVGIASAQGSPVLNTNCVYGNTTDYQGLSAGATDIFSNPLLFNTTTTPYDYRIDLQSPCAPIANPSVVLPGAVDSYGNKFVAPMSNAINAPLGAPIGAYVPQVLAPVIVPFGQKSTAPMRVTMTCPTPDSSIYYTTNGSNPSSDMTDRPDITVYAPPSILLSATTTITAIGGKANLKDSDTRRAIFTLTPLTFTPAPSLNHSLSSLPLQVTIGPASPGVTLRYTVDGSYPTSTSPACGVAGGAGSVTLTGNATLYVTPFAPDGTSGTRQGGQYAFVSGGGPGTSYQYEIRRLNNTPQPVSNLRVTDIYEPTNVRTDWGAAYWTATYEVKRIDPILQETTLATSTSQNYWVDNACPLVSGSMYQYAVRIASAHDYDPGYSEDIPADATPDQIYICNYYSAGPWTTIPVTPIRAIATENQTVDSRYDQRCADNRLMNYQFKNKTYYGGLYAGYVSAPDHSRVGRSFLKFQLPVHPANTSLWTASMNAYYTRSANDGSTNVGCYYVPDNLWNGAALDWAGAPGIGSMLSTSTVTYNSLTLQPLWCHWPVTSVIPSESGSDQWLSFALASTSESTPGWAYFAKKEYGDGSMAPTLLLGYRDLPTTDAVRLTLSSYDVLAGTSVIGTVHLSNPAPSSGLLISTWSDNDAATTSDFRIPAGATQGDFTIRTVAGNVATFHIGAILPDGLVTRTLNTHL